MCQRTPKRGPEGHINDLYQRFKNQEEGFSDLSIQVDKLSEKVDSVSSRLSNRLDKVEDRLDKVERKLDNIERKLDTIISHLPQPDNIETNE